MEQRSDEWFAARRGRITASAVGAILGVAPYQTRLQCLRRMVREAHGAPSEFTGNIATEYGTFNEPGALIDYRIHTGNTVEEVGFIPFEDWAGCSPDGLVGDEGGLEIKAPYGKRKDAVPEFKDIYHQPHYYAQVQFSLFCTGRKWWHFWQWSPNGTSLETVSADPQWCAENLPIIRQFYAEYLDAVKDPAEYLAPLRVELDGIQYAKMLVEYDEMEEAESRAKERKREILEQLQVAAGDRSALVCGRKLTRVESKGSVSYAKALAEAAPGFDVEPFRGKGSVSWRLS